jgi:amino acid transporter
MFLTAVVILFFAVLTIMGVKDSAKVAKLIFIFHIFTLTLLISMGLIHAFNVGWGVLIQNWESTKELFLQRPPAEMLVLAFAASLLGVSGFESSANFVEEQKPGVFRKTLQYMLVGVVIFNPLIALVILNTLDMPTIKLSTDFVLSEAAVQIGGQALQWIVVSDAFLVLSGAVLASFVGATGLLYRMTLDHCLPSTLLLPRLKFRNENTYRLIMLFAALCLSILFVTKGELLSLAGVYTISFLGVMTAFALGNLILRKNRTDLKRTYQSHVVFVIIAAISTLVGIGGNIFINPRNLYYFLAYFTPAIIIVLTMIYRDYILEWLMAALKPVPFLQKLIEPLFLHVINTRIVLFAHHPEKLYSSLDYIRRNETSRRITIVFCKNKSHTSEEQVESFKKFITFFTEARIFPHFDLDFIVEEEMVFGPETVKAYASRFRIGRNNIFIGSIHSFHDFTFDDLGGVRIIQ